MNNTGIQPLGYNILLKMPEERKETKNGILLPDSKTTNLIDCVGKILGLGCNAFKDAFNDLDAQAPKEGDYVYINSHAGKDIKIDNELYRMVSSDDVRGTLTEDRYKQFIR
jgi:co-chaperonin GroES (HSP10)